MTARPEAAMPGGDALFRALSECSPVGLFLADVEGRCTYINPRYQGLTGTSLEESLGEGWARNLHPGDRDRVVAEWSAAAHAGRTYTSEFRLAFLQGVVRWVSVRTAPLWSAEGVLLGHVGTVDDVTERRQVEAQRDVLSARELVANTSARVATARYRALFDAAADAILVADAEGRLHDVNRAAIELLGYSYEDLLTMRVPDIIGREFAWTESEYARFAQDGRWRGELEMRRKDGVIVPVDIRGVRADLPTGDVYFAVIRDISDRRREEQKRERLLRGLAAASLAIASAGSVDEIFQITVDWARATVGAHQAVVGFTADASWANSAIASSLSDKYAAWRDYDEPPDGSGIYRLVSERHQPIRLTQAELESHPDWRGFGRAAEHHPPLRGWLAAPLVAGDGSNIGLLQLSDKEEGEFDAEDEAILVQLAQLASVAIENARLHQETRGALHARDEALSLLEQRVAALAQIAAALRLHEPSRAALDAVSAHVIAGSQAVGCSVRLVVTNGTAYRVLGSASLPEQFGPALEAALAAGADLWVTRAVQDRQTVVMHDVRRTILADPRGEALHPLMREAAWDTVVCLPLLYRNRVLGTLSCVYPDGSEPTDDEVAFFGAVADQTAVAVNNARLFAEAQGKAALEERQRLARELHDSVSQVLYGIGMGASAARNWLDIDPKEAIEPTDYVLSLVQAGIAEMRALIFELRPESLEQEGLVAALHKHAAALRVRHSMEVEAALGEEPELPMEFKEALYRVGQEAMHNAAKHAHATRVAVRLEASERLVVLTIEDNGVGFNPKADYPGHFGLQSMRERVERLGGTLEVRSVPGRGARIRAAIPVPD
ncbi:MAG: hypothetical protein QOF01_3934 [Thermomicrobiales bacterium]|nr:hypothetical protein [Thermomicrobiales bacterium]